MIAGCRPCPPECRVKDVGPVSPVPDPVINDKLYDNPTRVSESIADIFADAASPVSVTLDSLAVDLVQRSHDVVGRRAAPSGHAMIAGLAAAGPSLTLRS